MKELNSLGDEEAVAKLAICCGSSAWTKRMAESRPFSERDDLFQTAANIWFSLERNDWLEAFSHHPKIGDMETLRTKFQETRTLSESEQSGVKEVSEEVLQQLAEGNRLYEEKFGYIFIVCATGKTAQEMLTLLEERLMNNPEKEMVIAAREQNKITTLRLEKLITP